MARSWRIVAAVALLSACAPGCSAAIGGEPAARIESVPTRRGVVVPVMVVEPPEPTAIVVMLTGGSGHLGLATGGIALGADHFVVRARRLFADEGFVVILVDAPSDRPEALGAFRVTSEHAKDVAAILRWASTRWSLPSWLVGTSEGTVSAANAAARGVAISGLVLTSSITRGEPDAVTLHDIALADIAAPTLFIHHASDACRWSPPDGALELSTELSGDTAWQVIGGGDPPTDADCSPRSFHGFLGRDGQVTHAIAQFIDVRAGS
jgi:hypothetical protein